MGPASSPPARLPGIAAGVLGVTLLALAAWRAWCVSRGQTSTPMRTRTT
jgi:hypothetical protein